MSACTFKSLSSSGLETEAGSRILGIAGGLCAVGEGRAAAEGEEQGR